MSNHMRRAGAAMLLLVFLVNCHATGESFRLADPAPGKAQIYIYRARAFTGGAFAWDIMLDGQKVTELKTGGYYHAVVPPGPHHIAVKVSRGIGLQVATEADKRYYFRIRATTNVAMATFMIERVDEEQALNELMDKKLQPATIS